MKRSLIACFIILGVSGLSAQSELGKIQAQIYQAYLQNNVADWESGIKSLEAHYAGAASDELKLELARLEFGIVGICLGNQEEAKGKQHLAKAEKHLSAFLKTNKSSAEGHALMSGILGMKIGFSPMSGMWLGPRSNSHLRKAMAADKNCPQAWHQKASSLYHTPAAFGGDIEASIEHYRKAVTLYESGSDLATSWEYLDALAWLGQAYRKNGQKAQAKEAYEKALAVEPDFGWVKFSLLPQLNASN